MKERPREGITEIRSLAPLWFLASLRPLRDDDAEEPMKAAVLHAANQPLTIEEVALDKPGAARC